MSINPLKAAFLGFLGSCGGSVSSVGPVKFDAGTPDFFRASCIDLTGNTACTWSEGDLHRKIFSPSLTEIYFSSANLSEFEVLPTLVKLPRDSYVNIWRENSIHYQSYNTSSQMEDRAPGEIPTSSTPSIKSVKAVVLPRGDIVLGWKEETGGQFFHQAVLNGSTLNQSNSIISTDEEVFIEVGPSIPKPFGWIAITTDRTDIRVQDFQNDQSSTNETATILSSSDVVDTEFRSPIGLSLPDGNNIVAWMRVSPTNVIEGFYYRRFEDRGALIDGIDQVLLEGNLGFWNPDEASQVLSFCKGVNGEPQILFVANGDVYRQGFNEFGDKTILETVTGPEVLEVSGFDRTGGYGITWRNVTGLFVQIWKRTFPDSTTFTDSPASMSPSFTESPTYSPFTSQQSSSTVANQSSPSQPTSSNTQASTEASTQQTSSIDIQIITSGIVTYDGVNIGTFNIEGGVLSYDIDASTVEDGTTITLFTFANENAGTYSDLTINTPSDECYKVEKNLNDNSDGTTSFQLVFETSDCTIDSSPSSKSLSWIQFILRFFQWQTFDL